MVTRLMGMEVKERQIFASFRSIKGRDFFDIILDDRGRARNLKVGEEYILDLIDKKQFFERYERGSIPVGKGGRSEPDRLGALRMRNIIELSNIKEGQRVLDTATGIKEYLNRLSETGCNLTCLNISPTILKRTRDAIEGRPGFVSCDVETGLPFKDESFELVICDALLEYLSEPERFLKRVSDLIKSGGRLLLLAPTKSLENISDFYPQDLWEIALWRPLYDRYFNEDNVKKILEDNGLKVVEKRSMKFKYPIYDEEGFSQSILSLVKGP